MIVTPETLRMHLEIAGEYFEWISLSEWLERSASRLPLPERACAVTFDDGWRDNHQYGWPVLREMSVPATVFLVTEMVGTDRSFWPNRLARVLSAGLTGVDLRELPGVVRQALARSRTHRDTCGARISPEEIDDAIELCKRYSDDEMHGWLDRLEEPGSGSGSDDRDLLNWNEVREMKNSGLVAFGSHTSTHRRLRPDVGSEELVSEVVLSQRRIEAELGTSARLFCYPNGESSPDAIGQVRAHYDGAVTTIAGWNDEGTDPHLLRRIGVHEDVTNSPRSFLARLSGWI